MRKVCFLFTTFLLLAGCAKNKIVIPPTEIHDEPLVVDTIRPTSTPIIPSSTPTLVPSPTATLIPTLTSAPVPTLLPEEAQDVFRKWLEGEPDCLLPCWAGIVPGETTWNEALDILEPVTTIWSIVEDYECSGGKCNGFDWKFMHLSNLPSTRSPIYGSVDTNGEDEVYSISIQINHTSEMQIPLEQILQQYGVPDRLLVHTPRNYIDKEYIGWMILYYSENNFIIQYGRTAVMGSDYITSCGEITSTQVDIVFEGNEVVWDTEKILDIVWRNPEYYLLYKDIEDVTDFTIESFHDYYIEHPGSCWSSPISSWP
ncbi:hypothetical protein KQH61_03625 [bacterium]|nr:hypothetical protein [bacterium]MCB2178991.1 hypothetical protein [bacterium]